MDVGESSLPATINPAHFPAKLWRLVNDPANKAICWDDLGEVIVIDQELFEKQILSQGAASSTKRDVFKTSSFSSFVRQLNLYGFKKGKPYNEERHYSNGDSRGYHHFFHPNFKRNHPELVASLMRLTAENKAKLHAVSYSFPGPKHQESSPPCHLTNSQAMTEHIGTPAPPWYLRRNQVAALSPFFSPDKVISESQHSPEVASSYSPVHFQRCFLTHANHRNPHLMGFNPCHGQYHQSYYSPVSHYYHPNLVAGSGFQTGLFSPQTYYQAGYPAKMWCIGKNNQELQIKDAQEVKKLDVNLDSAFQIADEMMPVPPSKCPLNTMTPEKQGVVLDWPSNTSSTVCNSTKKASPLCVTPNIVAGIGNGDEVKKITEDEYVISVAEQLPEDAI